MTEEEIKEFNDSLKKGSRVFLIVAIIALFFLLYTCYNRNDNSKLVNPILNDNLKTFKDKDSLNHTTNNVIESKATDFIDLEVKDKQIVELQQLVKKYKKELSKKGSATNFTSQTKIDEIFGIKKDTIYVKIKDNHTIKLHQYEYDINLKDWVKGTAFANKDSLKLKLNIKNEYSVIIGEESQGWFKPKKPFVEVINKNPYSETIQLKTYQVQTKPIRKIGIGPGVYYGIGSNFQFQPFIGIGIQYNFIRF